MSAIESLCRLIGIEISQFTPEEKVILEAELLARICDELKEIFKVQYKDYFHAMKFTEKLEDTTMETNFVRCVVKDILLTEAYSLPGIAHYTDTPEDVIYEIVTGKNTNPSSFLLRRLVELHRSIKPCLYKEVIKKILEKYLSSIKKPSE